MKDYPLPEPSNLPKASVETIAESVAREFGYAPGGSVDAIVAAMGGTIARRDFWDPHNTDTGSLVVEEEGRFTIFVPLNESPERRNFTIAHELGHYVLHYLWPKKRMGKPLETMKASRYGSDPVEWEANWFAAAFLMPSNEFAAAFEELDGNTISLAKRFGVSRLAAQIRGEALRLI